MPEDLDSRYRRLLSKQLAMNEQTWRTLRGHGVTEAIELRLDFAYNAPDRASAESLKAVLEGETDYEVRVTASGGMLRKAWAVAGSTQQTMISAAILDQWVDWMVTAGLHQNCDFDGWGSQV
ncbi:MAG TPA: hypothetical protein VGM67_06915 [Gemmatimonadaceae bacterium]|jgi:hypothetical protein